MVCRCMKYFRTNIVYQYIHIFSIRLSTVSLKNVRPGRIELPPCAPHAQILPLYYGLLIFISGRWESNPVLTLPKRKYYRYTTARLRQGYGGRTPLTLFLFFF